MRLSSYISALALLALAPACSDTDRPEFSDDVAPENRVNPGNMVIQLGRSLSRSSELTDNTRLFQFHADSVGLGNGHYVEEPRLTRLSESKITFQLGQGAWNFSLVSCPKALVTDSLPSPLYDRKADESVMYEMKSIGNTLISAPELYTALIDKFHFNGRWVTDDATNEDHFVPDRDYNVDAQMVRNVAKVIVKFASSEDLDPSQKQSFTISHVPSTLNWRGGLYPDKDNPDLCAVPLRGAFDITAVPDVENTTVSDQEFSYIIPAHRGSDYASSAPTDTTTSLLRLNVDFVCLDGTHVVKNDIVLNRAPRTNGITEVIVSYNKRKLNVEAQILDWTDDNVSADAINPSIVTDKSRVEFSYRDTIRIESPRAVTVTKASDASWLTIKKLSDNKYALEANTTDFVRNDDYVLDLSPRSTYLIVREGNLERRIPVTQRPEKGTIEVHVSGQPNNREMWLSPPHNVKQVDVTSVNGGWIVLPNLRVYGTGEGGPSGNSGQTTGVDLTRFRDEDIDFSDYNKAFGRERVIFYNTETLDTASVWVDNLFIGLTDDIVEVEQPIQTGNTPIESNKTVDFIKVYGGSRDITVTKWPDFVNAAHSSYNKNTGLFTFASLSNKAGDDRYDTMLIGHKTDPDYKVTLWIDQAIPVNTPEFDFLVVKFTWASADVDITVGFDNNATSVDYHGQVYSCSYASNFNSKWVGYGHTGGTTMIDLNHGTNYLKSTPCLKWGGDATGGQGETVFFNAKDMNRFPYPGQREKDLTDTEKNYRIPRYMNLNCTAGWYSSVPSGSAAKITVTVYMYRGGSMVQSGTNFNNSGGSLVQTPTAYGIPVTVRYRPGKKLMDVLYDRKKHQAKITTYP